ncbi:TPA: host cell division inhibitor Icd-like protein [Salmonella enterica subsp. diarizonae]|nr:host cell division inhibitor Icd-like protein [Salmonella enterica]EAX3524710.1 host cell division inhibitor Icd-like protein [Salmonella enterica]HAU2957982.1 host cell division inhibitor Icd-like protein [Salmonella enterica subsp. diarizonae]
MLKFTWIFLSTSAESKALPVVLRTQADKEAEARQNRPGDHALTFVAKINTACPVRAGFYCEQNETSWQIIGHDLPKAHILEWGDSMFGGAAHA